MVRILDGEGDLRQQFRRLADLLGATLDADAVSFRLHDSGADQGALEALIEQPAATPGPDPNVEVNVLVGHFPIPLDSLEIPWEAGGRFLGQIEVRGSRQGLGFDGDDEWILQLAGEMAGTALLRRLPARREPPAFSLSRREEVVAALIARGYTNARIARELTIARTTVSTHVAHILAKLHFRSRAQVGAWVARELAEARPD